MSNRDEEPTPVPGVIASVSRSGQAVVRASPDDSSGSESDSKGQGSGQGQGQGQGPDGRVSKRAHVPGRHTGISSLVRRLCCLAPRHRAVTRSHSTPIAIESVRPSNILPPQSPEDKRLNRKTLVLDLDETLVHSSFTPVLNADFVIPIEIQNTIHHVYVCKRPGVNKFLAEMGLRFEVIIFTASLKQYANPVVDLLDETKVVRARLFREHCVQHAGNFVKDLSVLGRSLASTIIIDNAPSSYVFQPENALPCASWFDDPEDSQMPLLSEALLKVVDAADVRAALEDELRDSKYACLNNP